MAKKTIKTGDDHGVLRAAEQHLAAQSDIEKMMMARAGEGLETIGVDDLLIPRLTVLQALSPQIISSNPDYDPKARAGQIYDVTMRQLFPDGIRVVICYSTRCWNEWRPRGQGIKGIVARHENALILHNTKPGENNQPTLPNGNIIQETHEFFVLNLTAGGQKSFIPMAVTQLKEGKRINNYISSEVVNGRNAPIYYRSYDFNAVPTSNAKGTWFLWRGERGPKVSELPNAGKVLEEAIRFREAIIRGAVRGDNSEGGSTGADIPWENDQRSNAGPL